MTTRAGSHKSETQSALLDDEELTPAQEYENEANKRALDELFSQTTAYRTSTQYNELLQFVSRFHFYSPYNAMLIHIQKPGSTFVATATRWREKYGRTIKPGAQTLVILQPMGPVMFVFDASDTEGDPLPPEIVNPFAVEKPISVRSDKIESKLDRTIDNARRDGVRTTRVKYGSQQAGAIGPTPSPGAWLRFGDKHMIPLRYEMKLNLNHNTESQYATLVHELAHLYCGHLGTPNKKWWPNRRGLAREVREFEAESVTYLVCRRLGIDPKSDKYLSGYLKNEKDIPSISLECVMKAAGLIEMMARAPLKTRKSN